MKAEIRGAKFDEKLKVTFLKDDDDTEWYCCHFLDEVKIFIHPVSGIITVYYAKEKKDREVTIRKLNGSVKLIDIE